MREQQSALSAIVQLNDHFELAIALGMLFNLMSGNGAAQGTENRGDILARSPAHLMTEYATENATGYSADTRVTGRRRAGFTNIHHCGAIAARGGSWGCDRRHRGRRHG